jgi:16S rRNA (guanine(966)-N(2))-methyltransferase RsmD
LRIIAGEFKGRTLAGPTGPGVRPTSDGLRETLFNIVRDQVEAAHVVDAYAGTGSVGLEALSRGARHASFIEQNPRVLQGLEKNIAALGAGDRTTVVRGDVLSLAMNRWNLAPADLVFADPPYDIRDLAAVIAAAATVLSAEGLLVLEFSRRREAPEAVGRLSRTRVHVAGDSALAFYTSRPAF